ncbi:rhomboid family protein [Plebeiibacterium marinum]|uniref:Rhomboid family intramembrane serine protease n=1 Tax=Plebeiibacterium marinum TaxID=2992111 RepID=A0AAE3SK59_9BACT|nr:rhomboid family intramembrane serine protease [Plebeiobacterium marinum]MCW3806450.1 rhomboid family intramembrane serine protease [Plebeiobacterium marinum]
MSIIDEIKQSFRQGGVVTRLIYINLGVFVVIRILHALFALTLSDINIPILYWLSVPASLENLIFQPWSIITYMFLHFDFIHILFNMLTLFWFGKIFLQFFNPRQLLGTYFMGGISGALLYIISYNIFPGLQDFVPSAIMLGASASVMAIIFASAKYAPNFKVHLLFIGPVKLMHLALVILIMDIIGVGSMQNTGGHLAHIGGALFGLFYTAQLTKGKDVTMKFNRFMDRAVSFFSPKPKMKVTYNKSKRPMNDMEYNAQKRKKQSDIDRILDKIKASGYESLTKQEKEDLFNASNN